MIRSSAAGAPRVVGLTVYPVKSFAGHPVDEVAIGVAGPDADRRWMVVDAEGETLTARRHPRMLSAHAQPMADGGVRLEASGLGALVVPVPEGAPDVPVTMSRVEVATHAGAEAAAWVSELLGADLRLVWLDDPARRGMSHGGTTADPLALTDTAPLHVFGTASLAQLDRWGAEVHDEVVAAALARGDDEPGPYEALDVRRFRPNILLDGELEPFAEDSWERVTIGGVDFRAAGLCGRCVLTTVDPDTYEKGREPLRTLARHRRIDGELMFGVQLVPLTTGRLTVGDPVAAASR